MTSSICDKRNLLQSDRSARLFIQILRHYRDLGKFGLHAFVVMPDHFHALITVGRELSVEKAVQFIKGGFAYRAGKELGFRSPVWQKGFSEVRVWDDRAFLEIRNYIHNNPVRRHLVERAEEFPYSSASGRYSVDAMPQRLKPHSSLAACGAPEGAP